MECTVKELLVAYLSHDFKDGEIGSCAAASTIPFAAMRLAQETHAPDVIICLESSTNPTPPALITSPVDPLAHYGVEHLTDNFEYFIHTERGVDFWFMAGLQTDRYGNLNLHFIGGTPEQPKFRGPGVGNAGLASTSGRWYNFCPVHTRRQFVPRVDFITALGNEGGVARRRARGWNYGEGCRFVTSPLAIMDFDPETGHMRLKSVHSGHTVAEVVSNTGFELIIPDDVPITPEPTKEELEILRRVVDTTGVLRR